MRPISAHCAAILLTTFAMATVSNSCFAQRGGRAGFAQAGVTIDAGRIVEDDFTQSESRNLERKRLEAAFREYRDQDVYERSTLRKVSLVRLEAECESHLAKGEPLPLDLQCLAGLNRIDYVFVYPEHGDIVLAGPAEGFDVDPQGRVIGVSSGRPLIRLDDLIVALRTARRDGRIGCSIDPIPDRLAEMKQFAARNSTPAPVAVIRERFAEMRRILGPEDVTIEGVPDDSHFAQVLVEADYHMKLISIGLEKPGIPGLPSHLSLLTPQGNTMQRWWLTPLYDMLGRTADRNAFEFLGQRVQLMAQEEHLSESGKRSDAALTRVTTQRFSQKFTEKFPELAERSHVFAELQNLFDLAIVAALLHREQLPRQVNWSMETFLDPDRIDFVRYTIPRQLDSAMNYRVVDDGIALGLVGGGVDITVRSTIPHLSANPQDSTRLKSRRTSSFVKEPPPAHPWWWD